MAEKIPEQLIQEIISANDLGEVAAGYTTLKRNGNSLVGLCPFHKEKTPSFHVSTDRQLYYCFGCGAGGNVVGFIEAAENLDYVETIKFLAQRVNINVDTSSFSKEENERYEQKQRIYKINKELAKFYRSCLLGNGGEKAREYVKKRGITPQMVTVFGLGYAPQSWDSATKHLLSLGFRKEELLLAGVSGKSESGRVYDKFRDRLIFPIIDIRSNVLGFGGRIFEGDGPKYLNSQDSIVFNKRNNLFNLNLAKNKAPKNLILVEGYMDVLSLYQYGVCNCVASLGTALTVEQARLISRFVSEVVICYDTDGAGQKATKRALEVFSGIDVKVKILNLPDGKDPDEFVRKNGARAFEDAANNAKSVTQYKIFELENQFDLKDDNQKIEFVSLSAKVLSEVKNSVERDVFIKQIAEKTNISTSAIETEINKSARKNVRAQQREEIKESMHSSRNSGKKQAESKLINAERKLISLMISSKGVFEKYKDIAKDNFFSLKAHTLIMDRLTEFNVDTAMIIDSLPEEERPAAAAALSASLHFDDDIKAADEIVGVIKKEKYNYLIEQAIKSGDLELINKLVMNREKHFDGGIINDN